MTAIIAVAGTLLGSVLTHVFERRSAARLVSDEFGRQLRAERIAAYSGFVTVLTQFRRAQLNLVRRKEAADAAAVETAQAESFRLRGEGLTALAQVRLMVGNPGVRAAAFEAWEVTQKVEDGDPGGCLARADGAREALNTFVDLAADEVQAPPLVRRGGSAEA